MPSTPCRHCAKNVAKQGARGLCHRCFENKSIRELYPSHVFQAGQRRQETVQDLDRMIAEQMKCLPAWWGKEPVAEQA